MIYKIEYTEKAKKQIKKLDRQTQALIKGWIDKNLIGTSDPRQHGKGLTANRSGQWRYRIGDYRVLANIQDDKIMLDHIENEYDLKVFEEYEAERANGTLSTRPINQLWEELGL